MVSSVSRADHRMGLATAQKDACDSIGPLESVIVAQAERLALNSAPDRIARLIRFGDFIPRAFQMGGDGFGLAGLDELAVAQPARES
jgi:hypothetical protein